MKAMTVKGMVLSDVIIYYSLLYYKNDVFNITEAEWWWVVNHYLGFYKLELLIYFPGQ